MSNQSNGKVTKRAFEFNSDSLHKLKLMSAIEGKTQKDIINEFLENGLKEWEKSRGQSTLDWLMT